MLDMITDFWKPSKKAQSEEAIRPQDVRVGSSVGFGFVPQASLSGQRLTVSAINTYQFDESKLTSFSLTQEAANGPINIASMIFAESDGEDYLALSRRILPDERDKLFDKEHLQSVMEKPEVSRLPLREVMAEFKGWTVTSYKREIQGMKGKFFRGDFRKSNLPQNEGQQFDYMLLVSDSNEHAIEIEKFADGRMEIYATVYRRMSDIGEIEYVPGEVKAQAVNENTPVISNASAPAAVSAPMVTAPALQSTDETPKPTRIKWPELTPRDSEEKTEERESVSVFTPAIKPPVQEEPKPVRAEAPAPAAPAPKPVIQQQATPPAPKETAMPVIETNVTNVNGVKPEMNTPSDTKSNNVYVHPNAPESRQEIRAVAPRQVNLEGDNIECDLRVANKIIDEAIRNEMRLTDVVRRIVELPVAYPESVQIPMSLTDEDYALLAIRYGIASSDRNAIKRRIIEDLNDFSGGKKKAA